MNEAATERACGAFLVETDGTRVAAFVQVRGETAILDHPLDMAAAGVRRRAFPSQCAGRFFEN
jgi:hypothetical protein